VWVNGHCGTFVYVGGTSWGEGGGHKMATKNVSLKKLDVKKCLAQGLGF